VIPQDSDCFWQLLRCLWRNCCLFNMPCHTWTKNFWSAWRANDGWGGHAWSCMWFNRYV